MIEKSDSSLSRMLSVLDLFTDNQLSWSADAISDALQVSLPTGYRYVRMLTEAGLLQRSADSMYTLGPRVMVLDHYIRKADPVLQHALPLMQELVAQTGFNCIVSGLFGSQILDTHHELSSTPTNLSYGRGRIRPLFKGAAPKIILASFTTSQLHKVFDSNQKDILEADLPTEWTTFRKYYSDIRKAGFYLSVGEVDEDAAAVSVALQPLQGPVQGALSLVSSVDRMNLVNQTKLIQLLQRTAQEIMTRVSPAN